MNKIAVIRIRGQVNMNGEIANTLKMLRLYKKNNCVVIPNTPNFIGMINKVKDFVTYGEINEETLKILLEKRARLPGNNKLTNDYLKQKLKVDIGHIAKEIISGNKSIKDIPGMKQFFKLKPPMFGFEKGGIKKPYSLGGSLGYRKDNINKLLVRMV